MKSKKITLWQNEREYAALQAALARNGTSVEAEMQEQLGKLYRQIIPLEEQRRIGETVQAEGAMEAQQWDDSQPVSAFHIREHGQEYWLRQRERTEFFHAADLLRAYRRAHLGNPEHYATASFADTLTNVDSITPREFRQLALIRMENVEQVAGVFDIDLDKSKFSILNITDGWKTYRVTDMTDAAFHARMRSLYPDNKRWELFQDWLKGQELAEDSPRPIEIQGTRRLLPDDILIDNAEQVNDVLCFHITSDFPVDEVFGTHVVTGNNNNYLVAYAHYDMTSGEVDDEMDVYLCRGDGVEVPLRYKLDGDERAALLDKMCDYCQQQTGQSLEEYAASVQVNDPAGPQAGQSM